MVLSARLKATLELPVVVLGYVPFAIELLDTAEGAWRIPAGLVVAFFLPMLVSSLVQFYTQWCRPERRPRSM